MSLYYHKNTYEIKEISDNLVYNWEQNSNPKKNEWLLVPEKPDQSAIWKNGTWIIPEISVPDSISARQIRLWLVQNGFQLSQIDYAIDSIPDSIIREIVKIEWEYAPYVERNHPWLVPLAQSLGLDNAQIDQAFIEANKL